jgi:probable HAF family extracellular repeat protein
MKFPATATLLATLPAVAILGIPSVAMAASFTPLGDLAGGIVGSRAYAVSADGSVVVGDSYSSAASFGNVEGFRWTESTGMIGLGFLPTDLLTSSGRSVSANGQYIAGYSWGTQGSLEAVVWNSPSGPTGLGNLGPPDLSSVASSISADGSLVVGTSFNSLGGFRWTSAGGMAPVGTLPAGYEDSDVATVSADGRTIGGSLQRPVPQLDTDGALWDAAGNVVVVPKPLGTTSLAVTALSDGGAIALLNITYPFLSGSGGCPAIWTADAPSVQCLPDLGGAIIVSGLDISGDGRTVVGEALTLGKERTDAFVWTEEAGLQQLQDILIQRGAAGLDGWKLYTATAISSDGRWVVGSGRDPNGNETAFRADISPVPLPGTAWLLLTGMAAVLGRARIRARAV